MNTKKKIEKELLKAMNAIDEIQNLVYLLPEEEGYQGSFMSNLINIKSKLKRFLNNDFDTLARERKYNFPSSEETLMGHFKPDAT